MIEDATNEDTIYLEDNIIHVILIGNHDYEKSLSIKENCLKLANTVEGQVDILVDLNRCGKGSKESREIWKKMAEHEKAGKIALFGLHPVARVLALFTIKAANKKDICFFKTKEESLAWFRGKK